MKIQFITVEVEVEASGASLRSAVEAKLADQGEPLRWAITAVNGGKALIEAVVLQDVVEE